MNSVTAVPRSLSMPRTILGRRAAEVVFGTLFIAICAHIAVPLWFTPVPITLQTFAVLVIALLLSPAASVAVMFAYLLEGMAGLPVLSPVGAPGFLHLFGPGGGYLMAYPLAAALVGTLRRRVSSYAALLLATGLGSAIILLSGAAWLEILTFQKPTTVLALAVLPFIAGDTLKTIAAAGIAFGFRRFRRA